MSTEDRIANSIANGNHVRDDELSEMERQIIAGTLTFGPQARLLASYRELRAENARNDKERARLHRLWAEQVQDIAALRSALEDCEAALVRLVEADDETRAGSAILHARAALASVRGDA